MEIKAKSYADAYTKTRAALLAHGSYASPRGIKTLELPNVTLILNNPRSRLGYNSQRKFSLPFAIAESVLLFNCTDNVEYISYYNQRMKTFSDDGKTLHGSYGHRIADSISKIVEMLTIDRSTRQAVLQIYSPHDLFIETKDVPCTNHIQFMIREEKLDCYVTMRSNDFFWGLPYDLFQFTVLQEVIANELNVDIGKYIHRATSMHVYVDRHIHMLTSIKTMDEISFRIDYDVLDMVNLSNAIINNSFEGETIFEQILHSFASKKENAIKETTKIEWANKFLK